MDETGGTYSYTGDLSADNCCRKKGFFALFAGTGTARRQSAETETKKIDECHMRTDHSIKIPGWLVGLS